MICYFCNQSLYYYNLAAKGLPASKVHVCTNCNIDYYKNHANMLAKDKYNGLYFQFDLIPCTPHSRIIDGNKAKVVATFNHIPNISPLNINDKLKLYALFS